MPEATLGSTNAPGEISPAATATAKLRRLAHFFNNNATAPLGWTKAEYHAPVRCAMKLTTTAGTKVSHMHVCFGPRACDLSRFPLRGKTVNNESGRRSRMDGHGIPTAVGAEWMRGRAARARLQRQQALDWLPVLPPAMAVVFQNSCSWQSIDTDTESLHFRLRQPFRSVHRTCLSCQAERSFLATSRLTAPAGWSLHSVTDLTSSLPVPSAPLYCLSPSTPHIATRHA